VPSQPVPLTVEGLSSILVQPNDLPEGWTGDDDIFDESPVDYDGPTPAVVLNQGLNEPGARISSGNVVLWVFDTEDDARAAFENRSALIRRVIDANAEQLAQPIGEEALLVPGHGQTFILNQLVFRRCRAVVEISLGLAEEVDQVTTYGARLDQRMMPSVCQ
jgi:hypothetical protein